MDLGLHGKNCVVMGASRGIGRSIALALANEGANVSICARQEPALRSAEAELRAKDAAVYAEVCDIADAAALGRFLDSSRETLGSVDVLIHNASALALGPDPADWDASLQVDLLAAVRACDRIVPWMAQAGSGAILLVSSIAGLEATPMPDFAYSTAKAGLIAYAKKLAVRHARDGIRVNVLAPGSIDFPGGVWDQVRTSQPDLYQRALSSIPSGRFGTPEEVADAAVFLVSQRASWVRGACLVIDGGQSRGFH